MDFSTNDARLTLAKKWATKYGLRVELVCAVIEQESNWNPWAMRYEPRFYDRYIIAMNLLDHTEAIARATSFGLMQTMGQVAREHGFGGKFLTELCDADVGVDFGCRKLQQCFSVHGDDETALLSYNGGGDEFYPKQVLARVARYTPQNEVT